MKIRHIVKKLLNQAGLEIYRTGTYRSSMNDGLKWLAEHGFKFNTILDVGASDGRWSAECMSFYPESKYVLFEPQPVHSKALDAFAGAHQQTVIPVKLAVGNSEGHTLFDAQNPLGGALTNKEGIHTIKVGLTTIDATLLKYQVEAPFLLKLDTHGFEKSILSGANDTIGKCSALIIEAYNFRIEKEAFLFWELCSFLSEKGFRVIHLVDVSRREYDNALWQMDLFFIQSTWKGFDYISYQ